MKYYNIIPDSEKTNGCIVAEEKNIGSLNSRDLVIGKIVPEPFQKIVFSYDPNRGDKEFDNICLDNSWLGVSERFIRATKHLIQTDVQIIPFVLINKKNNKKVLNNYIINVITVLDSLDLTNSKYFITHQGQKNEQYGIIKYAIKKKAVEGHHIFKIKGYEFPVFVSEELKNIIERNKLTGFEFLPIKAS